MILYQMMERDNLFQCKVPSTSQCGSDSSVSNPDSVGVGGSSFIMSSSLCLKDLDGLSGAESELSFEMKMKTIEMLALIRGVSPESLIQMERLCYFKKITGFSDSGVDGTCYDAEDREDDDAVDLEENEYLVGDTFEPDQEDDVGLDTQLVDDSDDIFQIDL